MFQSTPCDLMTIISTTLSLLTEVIAMKEEDHLEDLDINQK